MKNFADRLLEAIEKMENPSCIGLDTRIEDIPDFLKKGEITSSFFDFNKVIIDATYDIVPAFKVQIAFYEKYRTEGIKAFEETINYLKNKNKIVFVDAKRNDIGPTAEAYSSAFLSPASFSLNSASSAANSWGFFSFSRLRAYICVSRPWSFIKTSSCAAMSICCGTVSPFVCSTSPYSTLLLVWAS